MTLFSVDQDLCKRDGICAAECPMGIIKWKKEEIPTPAAAAGDLCINCGHCVAVCPHGALSLKNLASEDFLALDKTRALSPGQTEYFFRARRSIRNFKEKPVDKSTLEELIRLASFAPSGHNCQPVHWRILNGQDLVREHAAMVIDWMKLTKKENPELAKLLHLDMIIGAWKFKIDIVTRNAPTLILAQGHEANPMAPPACTIAMTYLDLAAQSFGVGTCWCGYFLRAATVYPPLAEKLGKNDGLLTHAVMMAGYPKFKYHRMPPRNTPKISWME
ncbi:MAG: nitroreductase family protein [Desulfobacter sp.]|nr:MAG: nitroreductase family protein [Desulfobacter sp.]